MFWSVNRVIHSRRTPMQLLMAEMQAIILGIQGQSPRSHDLDWDRLTRLATVHGVGPLLHDAWHENMHLVPQAVIDTFQSQHRESGLRNALGLCQRDDVL